MSCTFGAQGGYARVPLEFITLPVSGYARHLLTIFCAAANEEGASWHGYKDLAEALGRSKASISAYVQELVAAGVIEARQQRFGNGFNYRRRIMIIGWRQMVESWRRKPEAEVSSSQKAERRVQQAERKDPEGPRNQIQENYDSAPPAAERSQATAVQQPTASGECCEVIDDPVSVLKASALSIWSDADETAWRRHRPDENGPIGDFRGDPPIELLQKARKLSELASPERQTAIETEEACEHLLAFSRRRRLAWTAESVRPLAEQIRVAGVPVSGMKHICLSLDEIWQPYWKNPPQSRQMSPLIEVALGATRQAAISNAVVSLWRNRGFHAGLKLRKLERHGRDPKTAEGSG